MCVNDNCDCGCAGFMSVEELKSSVVVISKVSNGFVINDGEKEHVAKSLADIRDIFAALFPDIPAY